MTPLISQKLFGLYIGRIGQLMNFLAVTSRPYRRADSLAEFPK